MEIENEINLEKNNYLNNIIGKTINSAIDVGLRAILPNLIEEQVIDIKNALLENGIKSGIKTAVDSVIDFGKSAVGIFSGNFESMTQVRIAIDDGGIIDTMSDIIDCAIDKSYQRGYINENISSLIQKGKNVLLENIANNIKSELENQTNIVEKLEKCVNNWKEYYSNKNFQGMEREYSKIKKYIDKIIPLENIIRDTREVESIHNLIKNNGQKFEITDLERDLAEKLIK